MIRKKRRNPMIGGVFSRYSDVGQRTQRPAPAGSLPSPTGW